MPIDFHDPRNADTYAGRDADDSWFKAIRALAETEGAHVVDLGCGGGTYVRAWLHLGAAEVVGVDSSRPILESAVESLRDEPRARLLLADAADTGLPEGSADIVFTRALVHHLGALDDLARECARLLRPGGTLVIQDRTMSDVAVPGSPRHPRGYFFAVHPQLLHVEAARRPTTDAVASALGDAGFGAVTTTRLWETRRAYAHRDDYLAEVRSRTGRSLLHDLDDAQLDTLVDTLRGLLADGPLVDTDRWTLWSTTLPLAEPVEAHRAP